VAPLVVDKKVGGHIEVVAQIRRAFDTMEVEILQILASQAAVAVEKLRATARDVEQRVQLAKLNARLNAFVETSEGLRGLADEDTLLVVLGRVMADALEFREWGAYLYELDQQAFCVASTFGMHDEVEEQIRDSVIPESIFEQLIADATIISGSYFVDHRRHEWTDEEHEYFPGRVVGEWEDGLFHSDDTLMVPMIGERDQLLGYIEAYDPIDRQLPSEIIVRLLEVFAGRAAAAIELQRAHQQLSEQARTDGLTGLYNHRCFDERLEEEIARARRYGSPLSVLMLDIDHFKPLNDTYGHPQGDKLLKAMADILCENTRVKSDFVAHYGGEEFVVILPNTPATGATALAERGRGSSDGERSAKVVAERVRTAMEGQAFEGFPNRRDARVTVSLGVAGYPEHGATADELVANADKALYLAKRLGRNCVQVFH
jgi:GGDEF domain-containing protein